MDDRPPLTLIDGGGGPELTDVLDEIARYLARRLAREHHAKQGGDDVDENSHIRSIFVGSTE